MVRARKLLARILAGESDANIEFEDLRHILTTLGFRERIRGGHHIFTRAGIKEIINPQPRRDGSAKPYQVRQVRDIITRYQLEGFE